jgi:hypothetical protein
LPTRVLVELVPLAVATVASVLVASVLVASLASVLVPVPVVLGALGLVVLVVVRVPVSVVAPLPTLVAAVQVSLGRSARGSRCHNWRRTERWVGSGYRSSRRKPASQPNEKSWP